MSPPVPDDVIAATGGRELGYKPSGPKYKFSWHTIRDEDPMETWNPPLKEGEQCDPQQKQIYFQKDEYIRERPGVSLKEHQKRLYEASPHIKYIMDKWNISPEHPGLAYAPNGGMTATQVDELKFPWQHGRVTPVSLGFLQKFGPNYLDHPEGTNCAGKAFALVKLGAYIGLFPFTVNILMQNPPVGWQNYIRRYVKFAANPVICGGAYASISCLSASTRQKDDPWNHFYGGLAAGTCLGVRYQSFAKGFHLALIFGALGASYRYLIDAEMGLQPTRTVPEASGLYALGWGDHWEPFRKPETLVKNW